MDATQPVATTPHVLDRHLGRAVRRVSLGLLLLVLLGVAGLVAFGKSYDGRILPGVVVGGVAVGGLTEAEARTAVDGALGALEDGQIQLVSSRTTGVISYAEVGRSIDDDGMLAEALGHGRGATRFEEAIAGLQGLLRPTTVPIRIDYDRSALATKLAAFRDLGARPSTDARARVVHGTFVAMPSHEGVSVDTTAIEARIDAALVDPTTPPVIRLEADSTPVMPVTSDADVARAIEQARRLAAPIKIKAASRSWTITPKVLTGWMGFEGSGSTYGPTVDTSRATKILKNIKKHVLVKPTNATFMRDRGGRIFGVSASSAGRALDVEATVDSIVSILDGRAVGAKTPSSVAVSTKAVGPDVTTGEATKKAPLVERIGSWTTYYQVSAHNGFSANITVPAATAERRRRPARRDVRFLAGARARSASGPAIGSAARSSAATASRARRSPAGSAPRRRRCSTPPRAAGSRSSRGSRTGTTSRATRSASMRPCPTRRRCGSGTTPTTRS